MSVAPLVLYAVALVAYVWHFARRDAAVGRAATTLLLAAALTHSGERHGTDPAIAGQGAYFFASLMLLSSASCTTSPRSVSSTRSTRSAVRLGVSCWARASCLLVVVAGCRQLLGLNDLPDGGTDATDLVTIVDTVTCFRFADG